MTLQKEFGLFPYENYDLREPTNEEYSAHPLGIIAVTRGMHFKPGGRSRNSRLYPYSLWEIVLQNKNIIKKANNHLILGTIGHDLDIADPEIREGKFSHFTKNMRIDDDPNGQDFGLGISKFGYAESYIVDTDVGKNLYRCLKSKIKLLVSSRADGTYTGKLRGGNIMDPNNYIFERFDFVSSAGFEDADPEFKPVSIPVNIDFKDKNENLNTNGGIMKTNEAEDTKKNDTSAKDDTKEKDNTTKDQPKNEKGKKSENEPKKDDEVEKEKGEQPKNEKGKKSEDESKKDEPENKDAEKKEDADVNQGKPMNKKSESNIEKTIESLLNENTSLKGKLEKYKILESFGSPEVITETLKNLKSFTAKHESLSLAEECIAMAEEFFSQWGKPKDLAVKLKRAKGTDEAKYESLSDLGSPIEIRDNCTAVEKFFEEYGSPLEIKDSFAKMNEYIDSNKANESKVDSNLTKLTARYGDLKAIMKKLNESELRDKAIKISEVTSFDFDKVLAKVNEGWNQDQIVEFYRNNRKANEAFIPHIIEKSTKKQLLPSFENESFTKRILNK